MILKKVVIAFLAGGVVAPAQAETPERPWTVALNGSAAQDSEASQQTTGSGSVSLQYDFGDVQLGGSIGASTANVAVPDVLNVVKASSINSSVFASTAVQGFNLAATLGYGRQSLDATATAAPKAIAAIANRSVQLNGSITSISVGATVGRSFGERLSVTPSIGVSYDSTKTDGSARLPNGPGNGSGAAKTDSGVTFTGGIDLSYKISDSFSVGGAATFVAASNAAAARFSNRRGGAFLQQPQIAAGSEQWGELSGISILALSKALSLSASVGTTVNLPSRQTFGSAGLSFAF